MMGRCVRKLGLWFFSLMRLVELESPVNKSTITAAKRILTQRRTNDTAVPNVKNPRTRGFGGGCVAGWSMSKRRLVIAAVVVEGRTHAEVAAEYGNLGHG